MDRVLLGNDGFIAAAQPMMRCGIRDIPLSIPMECNAAKRNKILFPCPVSNRESDIGSLLNNPEWMK